MSTQPEKTPKNGHRGRKLPFSGGNRAFGLFRQRVSWSPVDLWAGEPVIALGGAAGGAWLGYVNPEHAVDVALIAATLLAVIIGAVVAGLAIIPAVLDRSFLRTIKAAAREHGLQEPRAIYFLSPFFTVVCNGVVAGFALLLYAAVSDCSTNWRMGFAAASGLFTAWTLTSLLLALGNLARFVDILESSVEE